jgi:hypothetical protein
MYSTFFALYADILSYPPTEQTINQNYDHMSNPKLIKPTSFCKNNGPFFDDSINHYTYYSIGAK